MAGATNTPKESGIMKRVLRWLKELLALGLSLLFASLLGVGLLIQWPPWLALLFGVATLVFMLIFLSGRLPENRKPVCGVAALVVLVIAAVIAHALRLPWWLLFWSVLAIGSAAMITNRWLGEHRQWFWVVLLGLAVLFYLGSLSHQAGWSFRDEPPIAWATREVASPHGSLVLAIAYPGEVWFEAPDKAGWPISAYLWPPVVPETPTSSAAPPSPTPTATDSPTLTVVPTATAAITGTASALAAPQTATSTPTRQPTETPTSTPTSTAPHAAQLTVGRVVSYTVAFTPANGSLLFTDAKGVPVAPQMVVWPGQPADKQAVLYVRQALTNTLSASVPISVELYRPDGSILPGPPLYMHLEDSYSAQWRHFWGFALGPTTPLLALAATVIGFAWQWWQKERDERRKRLEEIKQVITRTNQHQIHEAIQALTEVAARYGGIAELQEALRRARSSVMVELWREAKRLTELVERGELTQVQEALAQLEVLVSADPDFKEALISVWNHLEQAQIADIERVGNLAREDDLEDAQKHWKEVSARYSGIPKFGDRLKTAWKSLIRAGLKRMLKDIGTCRASARSVNFEYLRLRAELNPEDWKDPDLQADLEAVEAEIKRQTISWRPLWPEVTQRSETPVIAAWLKESNTELQINPFAEEHERAETDDLLPNAWVEPPHWEEMKKPAAIVVFGADGSGKTAALMSLMDRKQITDRQPAELASAFPVRLDSLPEGDSPEVLAVGWKKIITLAVAEATLDFLKENSYLFYRTLPRQQRALGRLLSLHRAALGDLAEHLTSLGMDRGYARDLARTIHYATQGAEPPNLADDVDLWAVLAESRLFPFEQIHLLAEISDRILTLFSPEEIASRLRPGLLMMRPLSVRGVHLKLFLPTILKPLVRPLLDGVTQVELLWEAPALTAMLQGRLKRAVPRYVSLRALFQRPPEDFDPEASLVEAALRSDGPPRQLIQVGRDLLVLHVQKTPRAPKLRREDLDTVLRKWAPRGEP